MVKRPALSKGELEVARVLWDLGEATVREVHEALPAARTIDFDVSERLRSETSPATGGSAYAGTDWAVDGGVAFRGDLAMTVADGGEIRAVEADRLRIGHFESPAETTSPPERTLRWRYRISWGEDS